MDSAIYPRKEKSRRLNIKDLKGYFILAGCLALGVYWLNDLLFARNFSEDLMMFMGQKTQMAHGGGAPDIENWFFITPLIPYTLTLYLKNSSIALAILSGLLWGGWIFFVWQMYKERKISAPLALMVWIFLIFSPTAIWFFTEMPQLALLYTLFAIALDALRRYYFEGKSSEFLIFAIAAALVVQNNIPSIGVYLAFLLPITMVIFTLKKPVIPLLLVVIFPTIFLITAPMVMNGFLHSDYSLSAVIHYFSIFNIPVESYVGNVLETLKFLFRLILNNFIYLLPFWAFVVKVPYHKEDSWVYASFLVSPLILLGVKIYYGDYLPDRASLILFPLFAILLMAPSFRLSTKKHAPFETMLVVFFAAAFFFDMFTVKQNARKLSFYQALQGDPFEQQNISEEKALAAYIHDKDGFILTDDATTYKVIYLVNNPYRFITPYQYRFQTSLSKPEMFVDWVLISSDFNRDKVLSTYPEARFGILSGFTPVKKLGRYVLFQRITDANQGIAPKPE